jgi:Tol biopolymer transport system component
VIFSRCRPDPPGGCALFSVRTDGTHSRALTPYQPDVVDFLTSVSPDGRRIAFGRFGAHGIRAQVYVMRADGSNPHAITPPVLEAFSPDWAPDGQHITFSSDCCRLGGNIYVTNPDGTDIHRLTAASYPNNDFFSGYSPDGGSIAFASDRRYDNYCCSDLFVMTAAGSHEARVHISNVGVNFTAWGTAPPISARSAQSPAIRSVSPAEAGARRAAWCGALPEVLRGQERCG